MASVNLQEQANFTRLLKLLIDKGTEALRSTFDAIHAPANLHVFLTANQPVLLTLRRRLIMSGQQWELLYPPPPKLPDSKTFDITLLSILLRNICGFPPPATGWDVMPPVSDHSTSADIARVKIYRNEYFSHITSTQLDKEIFEKLWQEVSMSLVRLGIPQGEIDYLKTAPLGPEEETTKEKHNLEKEKRESPESWKWEKNSKSHRELFLKLLEYGRNHPKEVKEVNGVRVCCSMDFLIGKGGDGTRVYVGLGKDGYEKAVKRLPRDVCTGLAEQEKQVLNRAKSNNVVNYWFLDDKCDKDYLFLILDLCKETLENFVENSSLEDLVTFAPDIIRQVLKGLDDLHGGEMPILHRDLKPSNILRNVDNKWLLADFGISRFLTGGASTYLSNQRGTKHWRAVESYPSNGVSGDGDVRYKRESDIQAAGMVAFYIVTKGKHPFGEEADRLRNLLDGNPVGLKKLKDPALQDLLSWMLSHDPKDRPLAEQALKHPYLQSKKQQFEMLCKVGNQQEIKIRDINSVFVRELNLLPNVWSHQMDPKVLQYLCTDFVKGTPRHYGLSWTECLRLIRNVNEHWYNRPRRTPEPVEELLVGDPQEYFLNLFPNLPAKVHKIVRSCDWKERPDLKEYFI